MGIICKVEAGVNKNTPLSRGKTNVLSAHRLGKWSPEPWPERRWREIWSLKRSQFSYTSAP